jgi:hypothetical protein
MRYKIAVVIAIAALSSLWTACGGPAANTTNVNVARTDTNNPVVPPPPTNNAPTLTPVFKAYCEAWVKNDEAGLRKVYSAATIKTFEEQMKEEKAKSLIKFLEATDKVSGTPCEVSDEQIVGDKAMATIKSNKYPRGLKVEFVKENGEWKLTNNAPTLSTGGVNSNSASTAK